jgi:hypothetical protein
VRNKLSAIDNIKNERKIKPIVRKVTFAEAELADDEYWAKATEEERLRELVELRNIFFFEMLIKESGR